MARVSQTVMWMSVCRCPPVTATTLSSRDICFPFVGKQWIVATGQRVTQDVIGDSGDDSMGVWANQKHTQQRQTLLLNLWSLQLSYKAVSPLQLFSGGALPLEHVEPVLWWGMEKSQGRGIVPVGASQDAVTTLNLHAMRTNPLHLWKGGKLKKLALEWADLHLSHAILGCWTDSWCQFPYSCHRLGITYTKWLVHGSNQ